MDFRNQTPQHENTPTHKMFGLVLFLKVLVGNGVVVCIGSGHCENNDHMLCYIIKTQRPPSPNFNLMGSSAIVQLQKKRTFFPYFVFCQGHKIQIGGWGVICLCDVT